MKKTRRITAHPLYVTWNQMKMRCLNPKNPAYKYYGGRGISICDRWKSSFAAFVQDMGERPDGFTLERLETNGNYEPSNCRWASRKEQMLNTRATRKIVIDGIEYKASVLAEISGLKTDTIIERAQTLKTLEEILDPKRRIFYEGLSMSPNFGKTHCNRGHEYTEENTYRTPSGYRQCRICNKIRQKISRSK